MDKEELVLRLKQANRGQIVVWDSPRAYADYVVALHPGST